MTQKQWIEQEGGFRAAWRELQRLRYRARLRRWTIVLVAIVAASGAVVRQALERGRYEATLTFRVLEHSQGAHEAQRPLTKSKLRDYIRDGVFTRDRCRQLVERLNVFPEWQELSVNRAVEAFRDAIGIEVFQNYFLKEDLDTNAPRSARLRITFTYYDVDQAERVVRALGNLIVTHEAEARTQLAEQLARSTAAAEHRAALRVDELRQRRATIQYERLRRGDAASAALLIELDQLERAIAQVDARLERLRDDHSSGELRAGLEQRGMLLHFDLVDWSRTPAEELPRDLRLALIGLFCFFCLLPIVGMALAAFDTRVYGEDDLRRLGLMSLGHVPGFAVDQLGTLSERLPAASARHPR